MFFRRLSLHSEEAFCSLVDSIGDIGAGKGGWHPEKLKSGRFLIAVRNIKNTDWRLVLTVPYKDILEYNIKTRKQLLLIFLIIAPLTLPLAVMAAASATGRITKLISHMRRVENGDFNVGILAGSNNEIGQLTHNFNYMLTKLAMLMDEKYKLGREVKNLELKALQAQINPHFLYNTLDLIEWMSLKYKAPEISSLVQALGRFYKLSLSNG